MPPLTRYTHAHTLFIFTMVLFGTIGIFRRAIPLPSSLIAFSRGLTGMLFLLLVVLIKGRQLSFSAIRSRLPLLILSGGLIGFNWILLFEAYRYTTVATATLCYYMAPILVMLASPVLLQERLTGKKILCVLMALLGMVFVSGVLEVGIADTGEMKGIFCGLGAAAFYACVILLNKKITQVPAYDKTIVQLGSAAVVVLPYTLMTEDLTTLTVTLPALLTLLFVGVVHTGVAYALYFGSMEHLKAQTVALFSYIDPVVAILLSALLLDETMGIAGIIGATLILGSTIISEWPERKQETGTE